MATKFERIFRLAKFLMKSEGIKAKPAIIKAIALDDMHVPKHPKAGEIGQALDYARSVRRKNK